MHIFTSSPGLYSIATHVPGEAMSSLGTAFKQKNVGVWVYQLVCLKMGEKLKKIGQVILIHFDGYSKW
jgi:hypothetical protein